MTEPVSSPLNPVRPAAIPDSDVERNDPVRLVPRQVTRPMHMHERNLGETR